MLSSKTSEEMDGALNRIVFFDPDYTLRSVWGWLVWTKLLHPPKFHIFIPSIEG